MISNITIEELCKRLRPVIGKKADQLYMTYILTRKRDKRDEVEQLINALYNKYVSDEFLTDQIVLETPSKGKVIGAYKLGDIMYSGNKVDEFGLREEDWCRHICISGMSGSGKTTLGFQILNKLIEKNKPFIVFDWKKSFRPLMKKDKNLLCFTVGNSKSANFFKININRPPKGVEPKEWINILCDVITESFGASYGVHKLLSETLDQTFSEFGVYRGSDNYPTWYQIKDRLEERESRGKGKSRESEWLLSALRIAHALTFGEFGKVFCYKGKDESLSIEQLLDRKVIFELYSLSHHEKKFFSEFFLTYLYKLMKNNYDPSKKFKLAVMVDEAHNIFLKDRPIFVKETVTDTVYREIREYGVSLICLDQHISKLSDVVAGNSACNIAFQQVLPNDVDTVANIMQIWKDKKYFSILNVGEALVKLAERHPEPFLIRVPYDISREELISDKYVIERMQNVGIEKIGEVEEDVEKPKFDEFRHRYLGRFVEKQVEKGYDEKEIIKMLMDNGYGEEDINVLFKKEEINADKLKKKIAFSNEQKKMLNMIKKNNDKGISKIYEALDFSARKGNQVKNELLELGMIEIEEIKSDKGRKKVLKLSNYS